MNARAKSEITIRGVDVVICRRLVYVEAGTEYITKAQERGGSLSELMGRVSHAAYESSQMQRTPQKVNNISLLNRCRALQFRPLPAERRELVRRVAHRSASDASIALFVPRHELNPT